MPLPLFQAFPALEGRLDPVALGEFPTRVERVGKLERALDSTAPLFVKRDDLTSPIYGGNKVRTLEVLFGLARASSFRHITAVGAFGSNHAVATALHAARAGLEPRAILFPQPISRAALENLRVTAARASELLALRHWSVVPYAMWRARRRRSYVMAPGGATPEGALGYVAAALELAAQVAAGELEAPRQVRIGVGSTCTTAGLLVGFELATRLGLGFTRVPGVVAVRVTPWPVTSRFRILSLAVRTSALLAELCEDPTLRLRERELGPRLIVDGEELGAGYGKPTSRGLEAIELFRATSGITLDTTYSAKAAASFVRAARAGAVGPLLFWSTKSSAPLPAIQPAELEHLPPHVKRWLSSPPGA
jgi:D-cysteine desulfhydrase